LTGELLAACEVCRCGAVEAANVELKRENAALTAAQQKNKTQKY
jgi:hypothetical protein